MGNIATNYEIYDHEPWDESLWLEPAPAPGTLGQISGPLVTAADHYQALHGNAVGAAIVWEKALQQNGRNYWRKLYADDASIPAILASQKGQPDRYITVNEFWHWRIMAQLRSLRSLYVDIDGCLDMDNALDALSDARLPPPTCVIYSGRGMHFYWIHEPVDPWMLAKWQQCQNALLDALKPLGGDIGAKDCSRVMRLVGTVNSRNGAIVHGRILDPVPYTFDHLLFEVLGVQAQPNKEPREKASVRSIEIARARRERHAKQGTIIDRWLHVYRDLERIAQANPGGIPERHRNNWLHIKAIAMSYFVPADRIEDELRITAGRYAPGLTMAEVDKTAKEQVRRAEIAAAHETVVWAGQEIDPRYRYGRLTLWEKFKDIIPDWLAPELRAICTDETKKAHERERLAVREKTRPPRDRVAEGRYKKHGAGAPINPNSLSQTRPWEKVGKSRASYYRQLKTNAVPLV